MFKIYAVPAISALFLSAIPASALTLECKIPKSSAGGGYVTELYYFQHEEGQDEAIVSDGLIMYYNDDQPLTAKVSDDTAKKLVMSWTILMTNSGQTTKMQFRASYFKGDNSITVRAVPGGGYSNDFEGRGKCKSI